MFTTTEILCSGAVVIVRNKFSTKSQLRFRMQHSASQTEMTVWKSQSLFTAVVCVLMCRGVAIEWATLYINVGFSLKSMR